MIRLPYVICCSITSLLLAVSCNSVSRAGDKSRIIQEVQAAGSGPVENVSIPSLYQWFEKHTHLANQINKECNEVQKTAAADWGDSPEGHVCEAASQISVRYYEP
jgi:hypothetical protein